MKYVLTVTMAAILMVNVANAQHVNIGLKGGLNLYNINNDQGSSNDTKAGVYIGLLGHIHLARQWAFQPELVFSVQGTKYTSGLVDTRLNLNYVNVPLLIQYMFDNGFRIQAGPQIGFLASAKANANDNNTDIKDNYKAVDLGLGVGMSYVHPPSGVGLDVRYNLGLSNINENTAAVSTNRGIQLGLFYLFGHKS